MKIFNYVILSEAKNLHNDGRDPSLTLRVTYIFFLVAVFVIFAVNQAKAQSGIEMELSAAYQFGEHVTFTAKLNSPVQIQTASIIIFDSTQALTYSQPVRFDQNGISEFRFDARQYSLHPFTKILWRYDLILADGSTIQSQPQSIRYDDDRFIWQTLESEALRIHWYTGDDTFGLSALNAAHAGIENIRGLMPADLTQPMDVFIYASENDLRGTLYSAEAWVAGHADSAAGVITVTIEPGADQNMLMEQRLPHELMHVMFYRQIGAGYKTIPVWLSEGMSMLAETYPNPDYDNILKDAAARDALIPMKDLCASFSPRIDSAFLAYAQSRSFTNYLRGLYGSDGLLTLANSYANGVDCERGTERVFGVSLAKLERDWRLTLSEQNNIMSTLGNFAPYLVLLCLVILFPLIGILGQASKKGNSHG